MTRRGTRLRVCDDASALAQAAGEEVVRAATAALEARGRFALALAGGSTPRRLYQLLAQLPLRERVDWARAEVFFGDERAVPPEHPDSNFGMAQEALLRRVPLPPGQLHRMEGERADLDAAARDYERLLARRLGADPGGEPPRLDLVLLGLGADGHTASLFPGTPVLRETARWVAACHVPKLATSRLTLTPALLNRARVVLFLVSGADKAPALAEVLEGAPDPERFPAQLVRPAAGELHFLVDRAAAAQLRDLRGAA